MDQIEMVSNAERDGIIILIPWSERMLGTKMKNLFLQKRTKSMETNGLKSRSTSLVGPTIQLKIIFTLSFER